MSEVTLETMLKIDFVLHRIAKREYPVVFIVEEESPAERFLEQMRDRMLSEQRKKELAMEVGIPVLDGRDVIEHLADEMDPEGKSALREEVMEIYAAKQGMVLLIDGRVKGSEPRDESFAWRMVSVEELEQEDVEQWPFLEHLGT